jgi:hypothetical protein
MVAANASTTFAAFVSSELACERWVDDIKQLAKADYAKVKTSPHPKAFTYESGV